MPKKTLSEIFPEIEFERDVEVEKKILIEDDKIPKMMRVIKIYDRVLSDPKLKKAYHEANGELYMFPTHSNLAWVFSTLIDTIVCSDTTNSIFWEYNEKTTLWELVSVQECSNLMQQMIVYTLDQALGKLKDAYKDRDLREETRKKIEKLKMKVGSHDFRLRAIKDYSGMVLDKTFAKNLNKNPVHLNFQNGLIDCSTGEFRKRTKEDYVSETLPYDFEDVVTKDQENEIYEGLLHTCNDDKELLEANLKWRAYGMMGLREQQKALFTIGHKAENGKSTLLAIFRACLSIYTKTLNSEFFNKGYQYRDKDLTDLVNKPIRYVAIEEADTKKMDTSYFKRMVDSETLPIKPLYSKTIEIKTNIAIEIISNHTPQFKTDKGMQRRMLTQELTNCFFKEDKYNKVVEENNGQAPKGVYMADPDFLKRIEQFSSFKSAFIKLLLPYAKEYCETRKIVFPDSWCSNSEEICDENDKMKDFIESNFEQTDNRKHKIYKKDFEQMYNSENKTKIPWSLLLSDIKRLGIKYERDTMVKDKGKGAICCLKLKEPLNELD